MGVSSKFKGLSDGFKQGAIYDYDQIGPGVVKSREHSIKNKPVYDVYVGKRDIFGYDGMAVELGYTHFGGAKSTNIIRTGGEVYKEVGTSHKVSVINLSTIGELPLNDTFSMTGRVGLGYVRSKQKAHANGNLQKKGEVDETDSLSNSSSRVQPVLGLGFKVNLTKNFSLGSEYVYMGKAKHTWKDKNDKEFKNSQNLHKFEILKATYSF